MSVFPKGRVTANRVQEYPIFVKIDAYPDGNDEPPLEVWKGSQKDLFGKYGHRAVPEIKGKLGEFKSGAL